MSDDSNISFQVHMSNVNDDVYFPHGESRQLIPVEPPPNPWRDPANPTKHDNVDLEKVSAPTRYSTKSEPATSDVFVTADEIRVGGQSFTADFSKVWGKSQSLPNTTPNALQFRSRSSDRRYSAEEVIRRQARQDKQDGYDKEFITFLKAEVRKGIGAAGETLEQYLKALDAA
jgi:hypothetical protein